MSSKTPWDLSFKAFDYVPFFNIAGLIDLQTVDHGYWGVGKCNIQRYGCLYYSAYAVLEVGILLLTGLFSAISVSRAGNHWSCAVYRKHHFLHRHLDRHDLALLLFSIHFQGLFPPSYGVAVCSRSYRFIWDHPHQCLAVRSEAHWWMASPGRVGTVLVRRGLIRDLFRWYLPYTVRRAPS